VALVCLRCGSDEMEENLPWTASCPVCGAFWDVIRGWSLAPWEKHDMKAKNRLR
jgi:hypothetical protein